MERENRLKIIIPLLIVIVSVTFHGFFILSYHADQGSFKKYQTAAKLLSDDQLKKERLIDFSPFYLYFHYIIYSSGISPDKITVIVQMILIALSALLIYLLTSLYFNKYVGISATFIFILSKEVLIYERVIEPESFMIFFLIAFVYFFSKFSLGRGSPVKNLVLASLFFSLTLITRANLFILILILPFYIFFKTPKDKNRKKNRILYSTLFLIPVLLTVSWLWIRNYSIDNQFLPYYQNPGYIMFEGNNPNSTGQSAIYPPLVDEISGEFHKIPDVHHQIYRDFARKITGKNLSVKDVNAFWSSKARNFIFDHPVRFLKLVLSKFYLFFHNYDRHDLSSAFMWGKYIEGKFKLFFPFWIISVFAFAGMVLNFKRVSDMFILYLVFLTQLGVMLVGYISSRQRVAVISIMIFFALSGIPLIVKERRRIIAISITVFAALFFLNTKNDIMKEEDFLWEAYNNSYNYWVRARTERNGFDIKSAGFFAAKAISETPWLIDDRIPASVPLSKRQIALTALAGEKRGGKLSFSKRLNRALLLREAGKFAESYRIFKDLEKKGFTFKRDFDTSSQPLYFMGTIKEIRGETENAIKLYKEALRKAPGSPFSLSKLFVLTGDKIYYNKLIRYFDRLDADYFTGMDYFRAGKYEKAKEKFLYVTEKLPMFRKALIYLAVSLERSGDHLKAYNAYYSAIKRGMDPVLFKKDIEKIFVRRVEEEPLNPVAYYYYGIVLEQCGLFQKARKIYKKGAQLSQRNNLFIKRLSIVEKYLKY